MAHPDPETGCGLMTLGILLAVILFWLLFFAAVFDWGAFA